MIGKTTINGAEYGVFREVPNQRNDGLDAVVGAYGLAVWFFGGRLNEAVLDGAAGGPPKPAGRRAKKTRRVCKQEVL